jgi:hypothetical protein
VFQKLYHAVQGEKKPELSQEGQEDISDFFPEQYQNF